MKYHIAIVGSKEAIAGFSLLGADTVPANETNVLEKLFDLKRKKQIDEQNIERQFYAIIFVTEDLLMNVSADDEKKLAKGALPAIIPIPSHKGSTGYSTERLKRIVERAIGSNILQ